MITINSSFSQRKFSIKSQSQFSYINIKNLKFKYNKKQIQRKHSKKNEIIFSCIIISLSVLIQHYQC
jgi:hypothetical protein